MKIYPLYKKITNIVISGVINFRADVKAAARTLARVGLTVSQRAATQIKQSPFIINVSQRPAVKFLVKVSTVTTQRVATRLRSLASLVMAQKMAARVKQLVSGVIKTAPAYKVSRITIDLLVNGYIVTASQDAGGTGTWANLPNAQGAQDNVYSTIGGNSLLLITGRLRGVMAAQVNRPSTLIIDRVDLDFYGKVAGLPIVDDLVSRLTLGYRVGTVPLAGLDTTTHTIAVGNEDFHTTPKTVRIDNGAGNFTDGTSALTWANISTITPWFNCAIVLGLTGATYSADAVKLRVTAHEVWLP